MLKRIGAEEGGEFKAVASGTLPSGKPVVVNADGTVSVISQTSATQALGSATVFEAATTREPESAFDSNSNKIVIAYRDGGNSERGTAVVGTVSGTSISFGTPVVFNAGETTKINVVFDTSNNKIVITYQNDASSDNGTAIVGTVSGTGISFGSPVEFETSDAANQAAVFDSTNNKVVVLFRDGGNSNYGTAIVGTVSGTSISFGTKVVFTSTNLQYPSIAFDSSNGKVVIAYKNDSNNYGTAIVGTVSGTSISFGSAVVFNSGATAFTSTIYDSNAQKIVIAYRDDGNSDYGTAIVGTVSGTSISFGSEVVYESANSAFHKAVYDVTAQKVVIAYQDGGNSDYGTVISGTVSGTSISFDTAAVFESATTGDICIAYDSNAEKVVIAYRDYGNSSHGTSIVFQTGYSSTNLTSENYIGMSRGVAVQTGSAASSGTPVVYEAAEVVLSNSGTLVAYDVNSGKIVIAYGDAGDSNKGKAIVGTVDSSDNSISYGTAVEFESGNTSNVAISYDANAQKVVIVYKDAGNSNYGTAIVGTVSGTSISFGTATVFNSGDTDQITISYDTNAQKHGIFYRNNSDAHGYGRVGTVSGTSISFGSHTQFSSSINPVNKSSAYDSTAQKIVLVWRANGASDIGRAAVATISGTSISFGSVAVYENASIVRPRVVYDSNADKSVVVFQDDANSNKGTAVVGTVSGTNISFGSPVIFETGQMDHLTAVFDSDTNKVVVAYQDEDNSNFGTVVNGTVSGTTISFDTPSTFNSSNTQQTASAYDSSQKRTVIAYKDAGNSNHGTAVVFKSNDVATTRAEVAGGGNA